MTVHDVCKYDCCGMGDLDGVCCHLDDRDWIMGNSPEEALKFLQRLSDRVGRQVKMEEVFYSYEEGKDLFPDKSMWQNQNSYPALRVDTSHPRKPCIFYDTEARACSVYDIRPKTCQTFKCDYLRWFETNQNSIV
jgi:Fe-S-cluster containining protein